VVRLLNGNLTGAPPCYPTSGWRDINKAYRAVSTLRRAQKSSGRRGLWLIACSSPKCMSFSCGSLTSVCVVGAGTILNASASLPALIMLSG